MSADPTMAAVAERLNRVGWDFADEGTGGGLHAIHPYPARFIPQIPRALIKLFHPGDESAVLDPFCGSGTTLVEARLAGLDSVGIDLSPLATLVAKVKTTPVSAAEVTSAGDAAIVRALEACKAETVKIPAIPALDHWFKLSVQIALAALVNEINAVGDVKVRDVLRVALSSIVVRVSNQDSDTRYAAVEKNVAQTDVFRLFSRAVSSMVLAVAEIRETFSSAEPETRILTKDILDVTPGDIAKKIGLVVTSPPYPNAYEYWLYHKYRMYWLGFNPVDMRKKEIGARPHYFKTNPQDEHDFERQMGQCFRLLSEVMLDGAHACFIVGRSIIHGREIDNEALLERAANANGFVKTGSVQRQISISRKSFAHGAIRQEGVVIFTLGR